MTRLPKQYDNQPELVNAIIEARRVQMDTGDTPSAIESLTQKIRISQASATRALEHETFQYIAMYPEEHSRVPALREELKQKSLQSHINQDLRLLVRQRDGDECHHCHRPITGYNSTLTKKDGSKDETLENLHLVCRKCRTLMRSMSWDNFQTWWKRLFGDTPQCKMPNMVDGLWAKQDPELYVIKLRSQKAADRCTECRWIIIGDYGLNDQGACPCCSIAGTTRPVTDIPPIEGMHTE